MLRALLLAALFCSSTLLARQNAAQTTQATQDDVEAAYLYNFVKFVQWPPAPKRQTLDICVLGRDPFGASLDNLVANGAIGGLRLKAMRPPDLNSAQSCAVVFFSTSEASHLDKDLSALAKFPVLTVSDVPDFVDVGGMIQFVLRDDRVRFEVNVDAVNRSGLTVSSQLLKVAAQVVDKSAGKEPR